MNTQWVYHSWVHTSLSSAYKPFLLLYIFIKIEHLILGNQEGENMFLSEADENMFFFLAEVCYTFRYLKFVFHKGMYTPFFILGVVYRSSLKGLMCM